jgi:hypothetical protein
LISYYGELGRRATRERRNPAICLLDAPELAVRWNKAANQSDITGAKMFR